MLVIRNGYERNQLNKSLSVVDRELCCIEKSINDIFLPNNCVNANVTIDDWTQSEYSFCAVNGQSIIFTLTLSGDTTEPYTIQWYDLNGGENVIPGETGLTYTTPILDTAGTYDYGALVTTCNNIPLSSHTFEIDVICPSVEIISQSGSFDECVGSGINLQVIPSIDCGGEPLNQWQILIDGVWTDIEGQIHDIFHVGLSGLSPGTYQIRVIYYVGTTCEIISEPVTINICENTAQVFVAADDNEICDGGIATLHSEVIRCVCGSLSYQWQSSSNGTDWVDIEGANSADYETPVLVNTDNPDPTIYYYNLVITCGGCIVSALDTDTYQAIYINPDPTVEMSVDDDLFCDGGNTTLHSNPIGGAGSNNYQWQQLIDGIWTDIFLANSPDYTTDNLSTGTYQYRVIITQDSGCYVESDSITLTVVPDPIITIATTDNTIGIGESTTITSNLIGGTGSANYQWEIYYPGPDFPAGWYDIFGANSDTYIVTEGIADMGGIPFGGTTGIYEYKLLVTQDSGCSTESDPITITII